MARPSTRARCSLAQNRVMGINSTKPTSPQRVTPPGDGAVPVPVRLLSRRRKYIIIPRSHNTKCTPAARAERQCGVCHRANTTLYSDTEHGHGRTLKGSPTTLPHEAGLAQRPELRRDARLHRLHADAAEVVAVRAHLVVEAGRALCCPGSFQMARARWPRRHGAGLLPWLLCAPTAAAGPSRPPRRTSQGYRGQGSAPTRGPEDGTRSCAPLPDHPKGGPDFSTAGPTSPLSPSTQYRPVGTRTRRDPCSRCWTVSPPIATTRLVISASPSGERRTTTSPREMRLSLALTLSRKTRSRISPLEQPSFWHGMGERLSGCTRGRRLVVQRGRGEGERLSQGCTRGRIGLIAQRGSDGRRRTKVGCIDRPLTRHTWL